MECGFLHQFERSFPGCLAYQVRSISDCFNFIDCRRIGVRKGAQTTRHQYQYATHLHHDQRHGANVCEIKVKVRTKLSTIKLAPRCVFERCFHVCVRANFTLSVPKS